MDNKKDFEYKFDVENQKGEEFEDIVSSSSMKTNSEQDEVPFSSFAKNHRYEKKPHGFFGKLGKWWRNRKTWQKSIMITFASLLLVISIALAAFFILFDYNYNDITDNPDDLGFEDVRDENIINIALFGIDTRNTKSFKGNSDSIMVLSLDTLNKKVRIVSLMRDTFVPIEHNGKNGYGKINSAYAKGGPELAIKTINKVYGLDISEYATVNFYGMVDIIDAVGGIDAELTSREVQSGDGTLHTLNGCIDEICANMGVDSSKHHIFKAGKHHLNGIQAVAYSRIRYVPNIWGTNNDYGRTDRQRHVMEQLFNKAITLDKTQYIKLAKSLIPCSETSLSYTQIINLATSVLLHSPTFEQARLPQQDFLMPSPSGYGSVVYYDLDFAKKLIDAFFYEGIHPDDYIAANGIEKNDWYRDKYGYSDSGTASIPQISGNTSGTTSDASDSSDDLTSSDIDSSGTEGTESDNSSSGEASSDNSSGEDTSSSNSSETEGNESNTPPPTEQNPQSPENTTRKR